MLHLRNHHRWHPIIYVDMLAHIFNYYGVHLHCKGAKKSFGFIHSFNYLPPSRKVKEKLKEYIGKLKISPLTVG